MKVNISGPEYDSLGEFLSGEKKKLGSLTFRQRVRYLWDYYKLPFVILFILLYIPGFMIYRHLTNKDVLLYLGTVNVVPTEETATRLTQDYLDYTEGNPKRQEVRFYKGWYLTTDKDSQYFEYTYASQLKILASIDDEQLDVVLLDREAFDAFSQNGYLYDLDELLQNESIYDTVKSDIVTNIEFLEDNAKDINFDATIEFESKNAEYSMGIDVSSCPAFTDAEYSDTIYLAVIANTPRTEEVIRYITYLYS